MKNKKINLAAAYIRCAAPNEMQILEQMKSISEYAEKHNLQILAYYIEYPSGHSIKELLSVIKSGVSKIKHLLMYDFSRWGRSKTEAQIKRLQKTLKDSGVQIHETNIPDNSFLSEITKTIKRTMAHEWYMEQLAKRKVRREARR